MGVNFINCLRPIGALRPTFGPVKSFSKVGRRAQIGRKTVYEINPRSPLQNLSILFQLEKSFGDTKHIRRVFQRALERVKDLPEVICEAW